ncbi:hypothetical protein F5884DRAFT_778715 [Xylogone sp. PMI_703]|nr:hypothetical protein F5884DRAFT_778715 [Xylogone sp. PMI_703]
MAATIRTPKVLDPALLKEPVTTRRQTNLLPSSNLRCRCNIFGCSSTFSRPSDLARHKKSIHGPKEECIFRNCGYATGRSDKMKEHMRKKHSTRSQEPQNINTPTVTSDKTQAPNLPFEAGIVGYETSNDSLLLFPNDSDGIVHTENTRDVVSGPGDASQPRRVVGFEALDQADMIFDNSFEMNSIAWSPPPFSLVINSTPVFDRNASGFDEHGGALWTM